MTEEQRVNFKEVTRTFELTPNQNAVVNKSFVVDKNTQFITDIQLVGSNKSAIVFRGSLGVTIDGDTLMDANTPAELFVSSVSVRPRDRFAEIGEVRTSNGKVDVAYTDTDNAASAWGTGYTVKVILKILLPR